MRRDGCVLRGNPLFAHARPAPPAARFLPDLPHPTVPMRRCFLTPFSLCLRPHTPDNRLGGFRFIRCLWHPAGSRDWKSVSDLIICLLNAVLCMKQLQAVLYPLLLTSLMYAGSFVMKLKLLMCALKEQRNYSQEHSSNCGDNFLQIFISHLSSLSYDVSAWRNYVVAPLTEELVFRACMIPLLLCGGFGTYSVIFFCPVFFSLAHLSHFLEIFIQQNRNLLKASMVIGLQLGYTVVFGSYASFLFIRTGHFIAPLFAHVFCNIMGLPVIYAPRNGIASFAFICGVLGFIWLLFPATNPGFYNDKTDSCSCWQRFCAWN